MSTHARAMTLRTPMKCGTHQLHRLRATAASAKPDKAILANPNPKELGYGG